MKKRVKIQKVEITYIDVEYDDTPRNDALLLLIHESLKEIAELALARGRLLERLTGISEVKNDDDK